MVQKKYIINLLKKVIIYNGKNIIESGIVNKVNLYKNLININILLSNPAMHIRNRIIQNIKNVLKSNIKDKCLDININVKIKNIDNKKIDIRHVIAIASGKGGVGKSTIASNISVVLSQMGYKVGLLDADIYGPSIPTLFNIDNMDNISYSHKYRFINPVNINGIKIFSIGFLPKQGEAIVWRGPMASKALTQFIYEVNWGSLDFLIIDLPPGTGDIHLSLLQQKILRGVIVIGTSQKISISDMLRTINMFRIKSIYTPIIGLIENMSFFYIPENKKKYFLFGNNILKKISFDMDISFLGEIPIIEELQKYSNLGIPGVLKNNIIKNIFKKVVKNILIKIEKVD